MRRLGSRQAWYVTCIEQSHQVCQCGRRTGGQDENIIFTKTWRRKNVMKEHADICKESSMYISTLVTAYQLNNIVPKDRYIWLDIKKQGVQIVGRRSLTACRISQNNHLYSGKVFWKRNKHMISKEPKPRSFLLHWLIGYAICL